MKKLTNKRLISYLVDHKHIDMVSVSKTQSCLYRIRQVQAGRGAAAAG
jgi:hypothetical protein